MMNMVQKMHALLVSDKINIWHFPAKQVGPKFYFWLVDEPENEEGHGYWTLDGLIEAAYKHIDPMEKKLPAELCGPPKWIDNDVELLPPRTRRRRASRSGGVTCDRTLDALVP